MCCDFDINGCELIIIYLLEDFEIFIVEVVNFVLCGFYEIVVIQLVLGSCIEIVDVDYVGSFDVVLIDVVGFVIMMFKIDNIGDSFIVSVI